MFRNAMQFARIPFQMRQETQKQIKQPSILDLGRVTHIGSEHVDFVLFVVHHSEEWPISKEISWRISSTDHDSTSTGRLGSVLIDIDEHLV